MTSEISDSTVAANDFGDEPVFQPEMREGMAVNLEGYEGPLDVLLVLARTQKVDLKQISILQLAPLTAVKLSLIRYAPLEFHTI